MLKEIANTIWYVISHNVGMTLWEKRYKRGNPACGGTFYTYAKPTWKDFNLRLSYLDNTKNVICMSFYFRGIELTILYILLFLKWLTLVIIAILAGKLLGL